MAGHMSNLSLSNCKFSFYFYNFGWNNVTVGISQPLLEFLIINKTSYSTVARIQPH